QEGILGQVFRRVPIVRQVIEPAVQALPVTLDQLGKSLAFSPLRAVDQQMFVRQRLVAIALVHHVQPTLDAGSREVPSSIAFIRPVPPGSCNQKSPARFAASPEGKKTTCRAAQ